MNQNQKHTKPPGWPGKLLEWFCPDELLEEVQGDLQERYQLRVQRVGEKRARQLYLKEVLSFMRLSHLKQKTTYHTKPLYTDMLQHNLLLIYRNFKRFKGTFFINLIGLSTGLACTLLIYLWVNDELIFDKFHEKGKQLFQVMLNQKQNDGITTQENGPGILAEALAKEMPEVEYAVVEQPDLTSKRTLSVGEINFKAEVIYASKDYFNVFSYKLIEGNKKGVLADKSAIVISKELALKLFKTTQDVVGKTVKFEHEKEFYVSGIFETVPANSSAQFDCILSFEVILEQKPNFNSWDNNNANTYLILHKGTNLAAFNAKIADLIARNSDNSYETIFARPYSAKYLYGTYENGVQVGGRIEYVRLFSIIAVFILFIACINFMNLFTAKASRRIKEVGIKKAIGADRKMLVFQYLGESMLMTFISLFTALLLVMLLLPEFNQITGKELTLDVDTHIVFAILGLCILTGIIAGSYPAFYLSGFKPALVLKGKINNSVGELWTRKGLVVFQFTLSVILIVAVLIVYKQVEFIQSKNLGYNKDNVLYFSKEGKVATNWNAFLSEVKNIPGVVNASSISENFLGDFNSTSDLDWEGKNPDDKTNIYYRAVTYDAIEVLGIEMKEGRSFSKEYGSVFSEIIFNEAAIQYIGIKNPIGKVVKLGDNDLEIIGIAKDFHFESFHEQVKPMMFFILPDWANNIIVKIKAGREKETITALQKIYQEFNPGFPLDYKFLDADYQAQYAAEKRVSVLSKYFAGLAILISCLGLFGLAAFTAERRRKEIGIRKVLGSTELGIVRLLSGEFTKMVLIAILIALPASYLLTREWLSNFAFSIDLEWWYFAGAGIIALLIAWLTVGVQAVKAARVNPVQSLRDE